MIKSVGKSEHGCCDHKTSRNITCCADMRKIFFFGGGGGLVVCRWGELGLGRRRRNRGREGQQSWHVHIYINSFWRFHRQKLRRWFWWTHRHVTVRICHFKSLGESVGNLNGEPVTSLYELSFLIRRWFRWKKK